MIDCLIRTPIDESHESYERAIEARNELVETVAEQDERVMEMFLDGKTFIS